MEALRVSILDLRPWEYDAMSYWRYERILHAQNAWHAAQRALPREKDDATRQKPLPIRADGTGPQLAP